jgi:hypothetical protein
MAGTSCTIYGDGANVLYSYTVTNDNANAPITGISLEDDQLGPIGSAPDVPFDLGPGDSKTLTAVAFVHADVTNTVTASGTAEGLQACSAQAQAIVTIEATPPEPFACAKPIDELSMVWNGDRDGVTVMAYKGDTNSPLLGTVTGVKRGDVVTVNGYAGSGNDVIWEIFAANDAGTMVKIGESTFHLSCSDDGMDGAEDCGMPEGDGKGKTAGFLNAWLLEGMVDNVGTLACNVDTTNLPSAVEVPDPNDPGAGNGTCSVDSAFKEFKGKEAKWYLHNNGATDVFVQSVTIDWPVGTNGDLQEIKLGKAKIFDTDVEISPVVVDVSEKKEKDREIKEGKKEELKFKFENDADETLGSYDVTVTFTNGCSLTL